MKNATFFTVLTLVSVATATVLGLTIGTAVAAEQCPSKPYSVADAKGQEQLAACLRLANDKNIALVQRSNVAAKGDKLVVGSPPDKSCNPCDHGAPPPASPLEMVKNQRFQSN